MGEAEAIAAAPASPRKPSGMFSYLLLIFIAFVVLYILGVGPAAVIHRAYRGTAAASALETIYQPLFHVCYQNRPLNDAIRRYVGLWVKDK